MKKKSVRESCVSSTMSYTKSCGNKIPWFPVNIRGRVKERDLIVPHSELAMHTHSAGKNLLSWCPNDKGTYAHILYETPEGCGFTHGSSGEVLSKELRDTMKSIRGN